MSNKLDIIPGTRYGKLTVIGEEEVHISSSGQRRRKVKCLCDCGNITSVFLGNLVRGTTTSCGCLRFTHRCSKHPAYVNYKDMQHRCYDPNYESYYNYGGRGITMCDEWLGHPEAFCKWADDHNFQKGLTVDRIDINGPYSPDNCRLITNKEQQRNRRNNVKIQDTITGIVYNSVPDASEATGVDAAKIYNLLYKGKKSRFTRINDRSHRAYKKQVKCIEDDLVFESMTEAAVYYSIDRKMVSYYCDTGKKCNKINKHFEFCTVDDSDNTYYNILELAQGAA